MAGEKFYLIFSEEPNKKYFIDEPIGYSDVDFVLEQKENRLGRDESLNGGENRFRFVDYRTHYIEKLFYYYHKKGFEADIVLGIITERNQVYESELHFVDVQTDEITYLECRSISKSTQQIIKTRRETKVDLFSDKDIDGNFIEPLKPKNMMLQAKPNSQTSEWSQPEGLRIHDTLMVNSNFASVMNRYEIENTYTFFKNYPNVNGRDQAKNNFVIIEAQSNLKNFVLQYSGNMVFYYLPTGHRYSVTLFLFTFTGTYEFPQIFYQQALFSRIFEGSLPQTFTLPEILKSTSIDVNRGEKISVHWRIDELTNNPAPSSENRSYMTFEKTKMIATAESVSYNSIVPTFRLIDVMRHVVKSISGQKVFSQRYDFSGELYNNVFFNGNLMRAETDKPFYVSLEDVEDFIWGEHKGDSEIQEDGSLFFGIEKDFYTDIECGFFDNTQFQEMTKTTNQKYALNEFKFKYGKYQSLKENTEPNSDSTIHGESIWTFFNKRAPNKLEVSIDPVRDAVLISAQQKLATKVSKDTATQDDETIFVVDVIETTEDYKFTETTNLQHTVSSTNLILRSNGEVNFLTLGIQPNTNFIIETPNVNAGTFNVVSVSQTELTLSGGSWNSINDGIKLTKYTYEVRKETVPLTNRTDEGFTAITNLLSPDKYSNLRYSIKRNILNYWNSTLATVNLFWKDKVLKNTYYKNNGKCNTTYAGLTVIENEDFIPENPILSPYKYNELTFANVDFDDYIELRNRVKKDRGYVRAINKNNRVIKVYPEKITYVNAEKKLTINGEEKFEKSYLTISNEGGIILVNDEMRLIRLSYEFDAESQEISLFDKERFRLYNPVFWDKVTVNGANAETIQQLISWLDLLS